MSVSAPGPTPYADVNAVLHGVLTGAQAVLGDQLLGLYLYGSLALGDFDPARSDIDFLVATDGDVPEDRAAALRALHARIAAGDAHWAHELEGHYVPRAALQHADPAVGIRHLRVDGPHGDLRVEAHGLDWVILRYVLREHGVVMAGPHPRTFLDPVGPTALR